MVKSLLVPVDDHGVKYDCLAFICPGCVLDEGTGLHLLPVNSEDKKPSWTFDGNLEKPTLNPSILTRGANPGRICHAYLRDGVFQFLSDCTHELAGQTVEIPDLPDWFIEDRVNQEE